MSDRAFRYVVLGILVAALGWGFWGWLASRAEKREQEAAAERRKQEADETAQRAAESAARAYREFKQRQLGR